jgi:hypothetical protein
MKHVIERVDEVLRDSRGRPRLAANLKNPVQQSATLADAFEINFVSSDERDVSWDSVRDAGTFSAINGLAVVDQT